MGGQAMCSGGQAATLSGHLMIGDTQAPRESCPLPASGRGHLSPRVQQLFVPGRGRGHHPKRQQGRVKDSYFLFQRYILFGIWAISSGVWGLLLALSSQGLWGVC